MPAIGLLGDVMLGRGVAHALRHASPAELWSPELRDVCAALDLVVCNLECCISARGERTRRIAGKPFFFRAPPSAIEALQAIGVRAVSLANNHALDYEAEALTDTLAVLEDAQIAVVGAGAERDGARRGAVVSAAERRVGIVGVSDHPAEYAAGPGAAGIAYAELRRGVPDWLRDEVGRLAANADAVIAFPHWGWNMTTGPAGWQRRAARELQGAGAALVAGHSAHVFHGIARGDGGPVINDLGDALDDYAIDSLLRNDLGVLAIWRPASDRPLELVGLKLDFCHTGIAKGEDAEWIATRLAAACSPFGTRVERLDEARFGVYA